MEETPVKINEWLLEGFHVYKENFGVLLAASALTVILSILTVGILAGPLMAGMALMTLRLYDRKGGSVTVGNVFQGFRFFLPAFLFFLVWGFGVGLASVLLNLIPLLGQLGTLVLVFGIFSLTMFGLFLIVDDNRGFWPASMGSIQAVIANLWPFLGFGAITLVAGQVGTILCGIGLILTLPLQFCVLAVAYREVFSGVVTETEAPVQHPDITVASATDQSLYGGKTVKDAHDPEVKVWVVDDQDLPED
jgi:uncharacterized membrane protein